MKKLISIPVSVLCISAMLFFTVPVSAKCNGWYIKRNGTAPPTPPVDIDMIKENGGFYINDTLTDGEKKLYLTFDAGYENGNIEKILDTLKSEGVSAAFFVLDNLIIKNTELVIRMSDEGHLVCNHTKDHKNLTEASNEEISANLHALEDIYRSKTGKELDKFFRFPEGKYSESAIKCVSELGYKTAFWSFAYADWDNSKQPGEEYAVKKILDNTHNGAVILLHPTSSTNAKILGRLISEWRRAGYEFGSLTDFL